MPSILITGAGSGIGAGVAEHLARAGYRILVTDLDAAAADKAAQAIVAAGGQARSHGISEDQVVNEIMLKPMPKKAFIGIDEIAGSIAFLISPPARNITGQTLVLDGGWTAH